MSDIEKLIKEEMDLCKFISYNPRDYFVPMTDEDYESLSPRDKVVDENGGIALVCSKAGRS